MNASNSSSGRFTFTFRILFWFLSISLVPFIVFAISIYITSSREARNNAFSNLESIGKGKKQNVYTFLDDVEGDVSTLSQIPTVESVMETIISKNSKNPDYLNSDEYKSDTKVLDDLFGEYVKDHNYLSITLLDLSRTVVYTNSEHIIVGDNISDVLYSGNSFSDSIDAADKSGGIGFSDFKKFSLNNDIPEAFIAEAVKKPDEPSSSTGYVVVGLLNNELDIILNDESDQTGHVKTYLVGEDYYLRSGIDFHDGSEVLQKKVDTDSVKNAIAHIEGVLDTKDADNNKVLSYSTHMGFTEDRNMQFEWVLVSQIDEKTALATVSQLQKQFIIFLGLLLPVLIGLSLYASRSISNFIKKPIKNASEEMSSASGQLSVSSQQLAAASQQNASVAQQLSEGAVNQAKKVQDITKAIEEMVSVVKRVSELTEQVALSTDETSKLAQNAGEAGEKSKGNLEDIKKLTGNINVLVKTMSDISNEVVGFVDTITDISEQTNLLALNAAIEAARAGEAGRGFTVVADEVRKLAEESSTAAEQVQEKIKGMTEKINEAVTTVQNSTKQTDESSQVIETTLNSLQQIVNSVQKISAKMQEVAAGSQQQLATAQKVEESAKTIASVTEENSVGAQQLSAAAQQQSSATQYIASAAQQILSLSNELQRIVGKNNRSEEVVEKMVESESKISDYSQKVHASLDKKNERAAVKTAKTEISEEMSSKTADDFKDDKPVQKKEVSENKDETFYKKIS